MENSTTQNAEWNFYKKFALRFVFILFILFIVLLDWSVNPLLLYWYYEGNLAIFLDTIISWTGRNLFNITYTIISPYDAQHNDRTYIYLLYFIMAVVALIGAIIWTALDKKRTSNETLYYWLTTIVRYYLAFTLFLFALEKFFKMQFPDLGYYTLTQHVGDMSPMSLAWAFFGYSYGYNIFMGIAECAALFLLFRRTTTFGTILTMITMANVMVVNYNYDVHAKMYPTALFIMALFLVIPQLKRLYQFFFTSQATTLSVIKAPVFKKKWMNITKTVFKFLLIGYFLIFSVKDYVGYKQGDINSEKHYTKSGISGVYDVTSFVVNKDTLAVENSMRWNQIIMGGARERIRLNGDSILFIDVSVEDKEMLLYGNRIDLLTAEQEIYNEHGLTEATYFKMDSFLLARQLKSRLQFDITDSTTLSLKGKIINDSIFITARKRKIKINDFRLMKSRFHWISESAYMY